ncbi:PREDICTED: uncharacterized protein LOC106308295 isoform X1 [Brassica oleracea var. oleracea]|uniref:uncharacterized protein LOC106308295 isoform X1 n=2 Tax=Brassica oleracea var. oleracea TaxID=109376 RepID=UPI0006A73FEB|nr:PREDICTED: uncharacterized protein LOC106308295 isoform X1 [Brassica oleracea var. oleracea]XP_013600899.1 PREDICTED: uncharacterized protein LOC106308295 isoform X1 [Brassica oleracea var. oleracea]
MVMDLSLVTNGKILREASSVKVEVAASDWRRYPCRAKTSFPLSHLSLVSPVSLLTAIENDIQIQASLVSISGERSFLVSHDSLLFSPEPLSKAISNRHLLSSLSADLKKVKEDMGLDYSYTQPSLSEEYGDNSADSGYSQMEADILLDQTEIEAARRQYPPQPEVEFGFPKECYCGGEPLVATSYTRNDPGRRYYTCENIDDGDCHVWKWWDVAATEEIRALSRHCGQLSDKVDYLTCVSDYDTQLNQVKELHYEAEQKLVSLERIVCNLAKKNFRFGNGFQLVVGFMVVVLGIIAMVLLIK